ncbi:hypothetical protein RCL_jg19376.t1 [Rhizophagus clarus]|uniref:Uncharacterized protein n=1 Tax=Rhizophagus clarus TaxID=94130 RepID=A0A8H3LZK0_9GLOM|nr:hypothetical protein RCL_jg19376.t1 [Rhizophagus clarus]
MYGKCSRTDLIINSRSEQILSVKILGNPISLVCQFRYLVVRKKPICYTEPVSLQVRNISLFSHPEIFD